MGKYFEGGGVRAEWYGMECPNMQLSYQFFYFLLFIISFFISRYNFLQIFRTSVRVIWKMFFVINFPLSVDSPQPHYSLNNENLLSVAKIFCWCSLNQFEVFEYLCTSNIFYLINGLHVRFGISDNHMLKEDILSYETA